MRSDQSLVTLVVVGALVCQQCMVAVNAFSLVHRSSCQRSTRLYAEEDNDFMRWARQSRSADVSDNVVELVRPLGLILNEDERGNVFVQKIAPRGNAARSGKVRRFLFCYNMSENSRLLTALSGWDFSRGIYRCRRAIS